MYLFTESEKQDIFSLSNISIDSTLRGYKVQSNFGNLQGLNISNVVESFCETGRKLFLLRKGVDFGPSVVMINGGAIHTLIEKIFKKYISEKISNKDDLLAFFNELKDEKRLMEIIWIGDGLFKLKEATIDKEEYNRTLWSIKQTLKDITQIEIRRFVNIEDYSSDIKIIELEDFIDGSSFDLGHGKVDAVLKYGDNIGICDLKSGAPYRDNISAKFQVTLYAMMMEAQFNVDVNWGAIVFPFEKINKKKVLLDNPFKDIFSIDIEIRERTLKHLSKMDNIIQSDELPPMCRWQCNYCNAKEICERGL